MGGRLPGFLRNRAITGTVSKHVHSMTGSGLGVSDLGGVRVEIRSVNGRHLDVKVRGAGGREDDVVARVRAAALRGNVQVTVTCQGGAALDRALLDAWRARLQDIGNVSLEWLLARPGVLDGQAIDPGELDIALTRALTAWQEARTREGEALAADMLARTQRVLSALERAQALASMAPQDAKTALTARLAELGHVSDERVAQEIVLWADRADVTEELVRLGAHLHEVCRVLTSGGEVGRRLDFLLQEIARELSTMGAKSRSLELTRWVIDGKVEAEKLREQIQNLE